MEEWHCGIEPTTPSFDPKFILLSYKFKIQLTVEGSPLESEKRKIS